MDQPDSVWTKLGAWPRAARILAGGALVVTLPAWDTVAAWCGVELRGAAAVALFPIAWLGCFWLAEGMRGVPARFAEKSAGAPEGVRLRARLVYVAATVVSLLLVGGIVLTSR